MNAYSDPPEPEHPEPEHPAPRPRGDDGFERFVLEHREALVRFLSKRTGEEDAKDIAQESLVRLMRYRGQPAEQLKLLMYRIAMNEFNDRGRRQQSQHASAHVSFDQHFHGLPSADLAHDQRVANQQELARVREAILRLPTKCRQVYLLNRIEGMSYTEIARHCGISIKAVEKHIGRALVLLRLHLRENLPDMAGGA
ncbi:RNA polymerase sigma factor [Lysobacter sp. Root667]|uniref:RNA polymerase sigma factor n=1 Tax=Lysobacter sp. Root667 TaxID=1736581 RepID=UPI0009E67391|nr:RNA polymerase sigma factor [Lysobacter sp. Root667]